MLIYNVTTKVTWAIHQDWLQWMQQVHIPEVMATGCFNRFQMVRLLETEDEDGPTYAVQYHTDSRQQYDTYIEVHAPALRQSSMEKWGNQFISFRSLMEIVA